MSTLDIESLKTEFVVFLRNSDIFTTTQRGVTTTSNVFSATASQTVFTLSNAVTRNIRYVTVDGASKSAYADYAPAYKAISSTITFSTGLSSGELVDVGFDYSTGTIEKVWPDYPEIQYLPTSIPRIGFGMIGPRTKPIAIGDTNWLSDVIIRIKVYDKNLMSVDGYLSTIRSKVKTAQKSFYHFPIVTISNIGPELLHDIKGRARLAGKVFEKAIDLIGRFGFES